MKNTHDRNQHQKLGLNLLLQDFQEQQFEGERKPIRNGQDFSRKSSLSVVGHQAEDGLLKIGERLAAADCLNKKENCQLIIPPNTHFSRTVIFYGHLVQIHCGLKATVA